MNPFTVGGMTYCGGVGCPIKHLCERPEYPVNSKWGNLHGRPSNEDGYNAEYCEFFRDKNYKPRQKQSNVED